MAKHASSVYESRRSREWLKIKIVGEQEFVIGGFTAPRGRPRSHFGALVLGVYDDGKLRWAGNVGTGFDQKTLAGAARQAAAADRQRRARSPSGPSSGPRHHLGQTRAGLPGEVRQLDAGSPSARAGLPGAARRQAGAPRWRGDAAPRANCCPPAPKRPRSTIDGHTLKFTNLSKVFYPDEGYTKRDVLNYYERVAHLILPHLKTGRFRSSAIPTASSKEFFFQKNVRRNFAPLAAHGTDRFRPRGQAHHVCLRAGPRQPALPGEPGLHRPQPLDEPLAHARQSRFRADRSGPAGVPLRPDRGSGAAGEAGCWTGSG